MNLETNKLNRIATYIKQYLSSKSINVSLSQIPGSRRANSWEVTITESISPSGKLNNLIKQQ